MGSKSTNTIISLFISFSEDLYGILPFIGATQEQRCCLLFICPKKSPSTLETEVPLKAMLTSCSRSPLMIEREHKMKDSTQTRSTTTSKNIRKRLSPMRKEDRDEFGEYALQRKSLITLPTQRCKTLICLDQCVHRD